MKIMACLPFSVGDSWSWTNAYIHVRSMEKGYTTEPAPGFGGLSSKFEQLKAKALLSILCFT